MVDQKSKRIKKKAKKPNGFEENQMDIKKADKEYEEDIDNEKDISKKEKNKKRKTFEEIFSEKLVSKDLESVLKDFIDMRKTIKKPMTSKALELLINKLRKMSNNELEQIEMLNESIEHSWQTIYPLKNKKSAEEEFLSG